MDESKMVKSRNFNIEKEVHQDVINELDQEVWKHYHHLIGDHL